MSAQLLLPCEFNQAEADRAAAIHECECLIAHFSEIAAEAARLSLAGASVDVGISYTGLDLVIYMPRPDGPACVRVTKVMGTSVSRLNRLSPVHPGHPGMSIDYVVRHRYWISYKSPLSLAEPIIEEVFRHFALIQRNMDACRVMEVH